MTGPAERRTVPGFCALCRSRCGAHFVVEQGRLVGVEPWPGHPTGGALCAKGRAAPEIQYHPARLTQPLRRTTPRGAPDPKWEPVSWDEALSDIALRLNAIREESGAHAVAFASASPGATALSDSLEWIERLVFAFGSPNFLTGVENCNWHRDHNHAFTFGTGIGMPDYAQSDLVLLWGFNPGNVWLAQAQSLAQARARGAKLVVIDPVRTRHAASSDLWLQVRPGTDAALALGLARALIDQRGHDEAFVRAWSNAPFLIRDDTGLALKAVDLADAGAGAADDHVAWHLDEGRAWPVDTRRATDPELAQRLALDGRFDLMTTTGPVRCRPAFAHYRDACEPWTPEAVEAVTGVPAADQQRVVEWLSQAKAVSYFSWTGIAQHVGATQADRALALLYALTGSVDAPGGNRQWQRPPVQAANDRELLGAAHAAKALGLAERPLGPPAHGWTLGVDFHRAVVQGEPYRVRALVGFGANVLMSQPDTRAIDEALAALEFQVHIDQFESPTARHADYLLPACTPWEREGLRIGFEISALAQDTVQWRAPAVQPSPGSEARPDIDIVFDLAVRLGLGDMFFGGDVERGWNHVLAPIGITLDALRQSPGGLRITREQEPRRYAATQADGGVRGFATPSRRIEFHSSQFAAVGLPPVPFAVVSTASSSERFPLTLGGAKSGYYCQSQHRQVSSLRAREPDPVIRLHPSLAAARGIATGDACEVTTPAGAARFTARIDDGVAPQTVLASFGWWQACEDLGLAARDLLGESGSHPNLLVGLHALDPAAGSAPLRSQPCDVRRAPGPRGWNGWVALTASLRSRPCDDVIELALRRDDGAPLPDYRPGQHVQIAVTLPDGSRAVRSYSFIGASDEKGHAAWRIGVRRGASGGVSEWLHRCLEADATTLRLDVSMPMGRFLLPVAPARPTVLMATGIGITPFLSMLESMAADGESGDSDALQPILLVWGNRTEVLRPFAQRVQELAMRLPQLTVLTRDSQTEGRICASDVPDAWLAGDARFYLCGQPEFIASTQVALKARGAMRHTVFSETFQASMTEAENVEAAGPFDIHFVKSGKRVRWTGVDTSLLALAEREGIAMNGGCRIGQCESCRVRVLAGQVHHRAETDAAKDGDCLACVAIPRTSLEIDA